jgi:allene oxide cyclase
MRKRGAMIAAAVISATAIVLSIVSVAAAGKNVTTIHVIEHATTDTVIDTGSGAPGTDTAGDLLTFANDLYDASDSNVVGTDQGDCVRIVPGSTWECRWVAMFDDGSITVEGPFSDAGNTVLAITGGTGAFKNARGQMKLEYHDEAGTSFDFIYKVITD